ncbi:site-specific integrase [Chryseobacterium luquanense]|nr:site-specific integrase [Chryseobacterium luquanense]
MTKNPFANYKSKIIIEDVLCLTEVDLKRMRDKIFSSERLNRVRDIFIFCCYTGLSYAEVKKLSSNHIKIKDDGERLIKIKRTKTNTEAKIPILPIAAEILEKYKNETECINTNKLLPVISNQKTNEYLKEIGAICEIDFDITFHTARHTFPTSITFNNGVPIETVSKMLGHKSIRMSQHYAKVQETKISTDMKILKEVLNKKSSRLEN